MLCLIKPDGYEVMGHVFDAFVRTGLIVSNVLQTRLSKSDVEEFFGDRQSEESSPFVFASPLFLRHNLASCPPFFYRFSSGLMFGVLVLYFYRFSSSTVASTNL